MDIARQILETLISNSEDGIHIVDGEGNTIYYNTSMAKIEDVQPQQVMGRKVTEYLTELKEDNSTLMNAIKDKEKIVDVVQHYGRGCNKDILTINTTVPVLHNGQAIAAIEIAKNMTQLRNLSEKLCKIQDIRIKENEKFSFEDIIGESQSIRQAIRKASKASLSKSSVLIYGETGSGKEVFAQSIHYNSARKDKPFVPINCAAIPSALLEGMLFGTVKGGFTGAENRKGLFQEANGGTVLLDEINSMEPALQSKLLRTLQDGYIRPVGGTEPIDIDVRIIATLNEEPEKLIEEGRLRKDFYYRLSVIRLDIPPLRERKEDIEVLANHFVEYYNKILDKNVIDISEEVLVAFKMNPWYGNIRELKNTIESAMNMVDYNSVLTKEYFENRISFLEKANSFISDLSLEQYLQDVEKEIIRKVYEENKKNVSKTAKILKISRQSLQYKLNKYKMP